MVLGDFDVDSMIAASGWGFPFFMLFQILMFFIMVNVFLAIINDSYALVMADVAQERDYVHYLKEQQAKTGVPIYKPKMGLKDYLNLFNPFYKTWDQKQAAKRNARLQRMMKTERKQEKKLKKAEMKLKKATIAGNT